MDANQLSSTQFSASSNLRALAAHSRLASALNVAVNAILTTRSLNFRKWLKHSRQSATIFELRRGCLRSCLIKNGFLEILIGMRLERSALEATATRLRPELSTASGALKIECEKLKAEATMLQASLEEERLERDAVHAERAALQESAERLRADQKSPLRDRDILTEQIQTAIQGMQQTGSQSSKNGKDTCIPSEPSVIKVESDRPEAIIVESEPSVNSIIKAGPSDLTVIKVESNRTDTNIVKPERRLLNLVIKAKSHRAHPTPSTTVVNGKGRAQDDYSVKVEAPPAKIPKLSSSKPEAAVLPWGRRQVEVVITRRPVYVRRRTLHLLRLLQTRRPLQRKYRDRPRSQDRRRFHRMYTAIQDQPVGSCLDETPRSAPVPATQDRQLFDLTVLPKKPRTVLVTQRTPILLSHRVDQLNSGARPPPIRLGHLAAPAYQPPKKTCARTAARRDLLLHGPLFKQCIWSTEFFAQSTNLDSLLMDHFLAHYFPFIKRLHDLNEGGIRRQGRAGDHRCLMGLPSPLPRPRHTAPVQGVQGCLPTRRERQPGATRSAECAPPSLPPARRKQEARRSARSDSRRTAALAVRRDQQHLAILFFISPLVTLLDQDLATPPILMQLVFKAHRPRAGHGAPPADRARRGVRAQRRVPPPRGPRAFAGTECAPRYMPPPYNEAFFDTGVPAKTRYM
ncbi:hypothetical protein B0H17DRAFT_1145308 [Mycena rosella]|uniref:Uncharacterized protein n=1 Tax=Mycena rosella TaxID=1033263 RepID=A0AAD7G1Z2_MYCRO|nr:hypothetical protein B0H17DRAFT_1145308 [Mycena rosella]